MKTSKTTRFIALTVVTLIGCGRMSDDSPGRDAGTDAPPQSAGTRIYAASSWSCSLGPSGHARCWGSQVDDWLKPPDGTFNELALGIHVGCGVRPDGTVQCWPGDDSPTNAGYSPSGRWGSVAVGSHSCGIRAHDRQVWCWGMADFGALDAPHGRYVAVAVGTFFSCALRESGRVSCWGLNDQGQSSPPEGNFAKLVAADGHACALDHDGVVSCWGGETSATGQRALTVAAGTGTCIIRPDETVACFGVSKHMTEVPKGRVKGLAIGTAHGCVVRPDDRIECWGSNESGQASPP